MIRMLAITGIKVMEVLRDNDNVFIEGPYAAPNVSSSLGIEARYDQKAVDIEARLLKTSILPNSMKSMTTRDFRNGPTPAPGSISEAFADETDFHVNLIGNC